MTGKMMTLEEAKANGLRQLKEAGAPLGDSCVPVILHQTNGKDLKAWLNPVTGACHVEALEAMGGTKEVRLIEDGATA